jgi:UDP-N-acetylglucosamine transferase subunit ALG13
MQWAETLDRDAYMERVRTARAVIGHAGTGTIVDALAEGKPLLVMPRLKRLGECVNDHQVGTAARFAELGHVLAADDEFAIPRRMAALAGFAPRPRVVRPQGVVARVKAAIEAFGAGPVTGGRE